MFLTTLRDLEVLREYSYHLNLLKLSPNENVETNHDEENDQEKD